jgi:drug/metabolite transporter (DMT)-like permease
MTSKPTNTVALGIVMMLGAVGCLAAMNMFVKLVGLDYSPFQAVFFRNGLAMLMVIPLVLRMGGMAAFKTRRPGGMPSDR